jgi:glycosyltransferase involved in cell wall biosynthesis
MSLSYDLATVVEAVRELPDVTLDLAGAGPDEAALRAQAADCARIRFHGYLDEAALRDLLAHADVGVIPMFPASQVGLPGKLADYAAAGLPVISSLPGETAELLARYRAGVAYAAGDKASFKTSMVQVRSLEKKGAYALAVEFDAEKLYNSYLNFVLEKI